jgi:hypothetical protein
MWYRSLKQKSSLQKFYGHRHNLVGRYEISISQITMDNRATQKTKTMSNTDSTKKLGLNSGAREG